MPELPAGSVKVSPGPTTPVVLIRPIVSPAAYQILLSGPTSTPVIDDVAPVLYAPVVPSVVIVPMRRFWPNHRRPSGPEAAVPTPPLPLDSVYDVMSLVCVAATGTFATWLSCCAHMLPSGPSVAVPPRLEAG